MRKRRWPLALIVLFALITAGVSVAADIKVVELNVPGCI